ncbi:MAG: FtsX-like permease family protein [candidate division Zixibacteria bacterium]|nr:FtsX-like permease family protein [candidate division Zixibacteria bacterium]
MESSVFQGNLLISDKAFLEKFPSSSGSNVFLVQTDNPEPELVADNINLSLRDYGISVQTTVARLAEFSSIENTYLSIFLLLGALGLLIGTLGLGVVLARNIQERQQEIALQRAVGISKKIIFTGIIIEYSTLMILGILIGAIAAIVSVLPGLLSPGADVQLGSLIGLIGIIIVNGLIWILVFASAGINRVDLAGVLKSE